MSRHRYKHKADVCRIGGVLQIACNLTLLLGIEKTAARSRVDGITATTSIMAENSPSAAATQTASHFQFAQLIESRSVCPDPPPHPLKLPVKRLQQVLSHRRWMSVLSETTSSTPSPGRFAPDLRDLRAFVNPPPSGRIICLTEEFQLVSGALGA
ncbi:hypothetical protein D3C81_1188370 [compost metagenome]